MKHLFSYGIRLGAIASYLLLFFEPEHNFASYANNMILIYEIISWITFVILLILAFPLALGNANKDALVKKGTPEQFAKILKFMQKPKLRYEISRYLHYIFIIFVGVFVGDTSVAFVLTLNSILFLTIKRLMGSLLEKAAED